MARESTEPNHVLWNDGWIRIHSDAAVAWSRILLDTKLFAAPRTIESVLDRAGGQARVHERSVDVLETKNVTELVRGTLRKSWGCLTESSVYGSFLAPSANSDALNIEGNKVVGKAKVPVDTLERYLTACGFDPAKKRIFLKTDTQGFDLEVLTGAGSILRAAALVQLEMSCDPIYESMPSMAKAMDFVQTAGFKVLDLFPVTRKGVLDHVVEYDCLLVRGDLANSGVPTLS